IDHSLRVSASVVRKTAELQYSRTPLPGLEFFFEQFLGYGNLNKFYRIYDGSGNVGSRSKGVDASKFPLTQAAYSRAQEGKITYETFTLVGNQPIRVITMPVLRDNTLVNLIQVGTSLNAVHETLRNLRIFLLTSVPLVLLLSTLVGRFMARRALGPVAKITETARHITHEPDLHRRIPKPDVQDEIGKLVDTFNEMMDRLELSFQQVRQFSSDASHELRTPLTVLKGQTELVLGKERNLAEYREVLASNLEEINYMSKILEDLFTLAKSDEGRLKMEFAPVDLRPVVADVTRQLKLLAEEKALKVVPAYLDSVFVNGDSHRLRQMVWTLLNNAVKYTPRHGQIKITLSGQGDQAVFTVEDSGIGIPEKELPLIFNRFYRVDKARSRDEGGSGLGLSICKHIVESHKGRIEVESQMGVGTKFKVFLPKIASQSSRDAA
ncbi:MAG: sensor histidine kinase, partial [Nitrospinaceae bacterium]